MPDHRVDSALQTDVTGLKWFKIYEDGLESDQTTWAVDKLIANKGTVNFQIPSCIAPGNYFLRVEISECLSTARRSHLTYYHRS